MRLQDMYSVIVTAHHRACRDFYTRWFGATVAFEASWFVLLALPGEPARSVAFMAPDHPSTPPGPEVFNGECFLRKRRNTIPDERHEHLDVVVPLIKVDLQEGESCQPLRCPRCRHLRLVLHYDGCPPRVSSSSRL